MKKERTSRSCTQQKPDQRPNTNAEETMRPTGRIITYMPFVFEMFGRISAERRVALMLH
jgi:hypothetical protein